MTKFTTTVRRGRPLSAHTAAARHGEAANDNNIPTDNAAAYAERARVIRGMRADGKTFREIADELGFSEWTAWSAINRNPPKRPPLAANDNKVVRRIAHNGGCSTTSGMVRVSVARVPTLERAPIGEEVAA